MLGRVLGTGASEMNSDTISVLPVLFEWSTQSYNEKREVNAAGFGHCLGVGNRAPCTLEPLSDPFPVPATRSVLGAQ